MVKSWVKKGYIMSLEIISKENKIRENQVQLKIFDYIDNNQSMIFNAGAGAGKTYALVESLKYIIDKFENKVNNLWYDKLRESIRERGQRLMKELFNPISTYGFPMVLSIYLLVRFEPMLKELKESVDTLIIINEMNDNDKKFKH